MQNRKIQIRSLKRFVEPLKYLLFRDLILMEPDDISVEEFLAKISVWLKLLDRERMLEN